MDTLTKIVMLVKPLGWIVQMKTVGVMDYELYITVPRCDDLFVDIFEDLQKLVDESTLKIKIEFEVINGSAECKSHLPKVIVKKDGAAN